MLRKSLVIVLAAQFAAGVAVAQHRDKSPYDPSVEDQTVRDEPPMLGIHWSKEFAGHFASRNRSSSPQMIYHGGKIMPSVVSQAIFWGPSWSNPAFVNDKISGLDIFYAGHSNSSYANTVAEYTGTNGMVGPELTHLGSVIDTTTASNGSSTSAVLAEVCRQITNPDPSGNGYYPVYSDVKRGHASYCAYHSAGTCHGVPVQFGFFFNLDGDSSCDPKDASTGHSQGLAALANVSAHELSEARSDPANPGAWYDASGEENGDKCAWTYHVPYVAFSDGTNWKVQGEWSNAAYATGTGYANASGQKGCIDGH